MINKIKISLKIFAKFNEKPIKEIIKLKQVDQQEFIKVCQESDTMAIAARKLNMHFNTFRRYAEKFECYEPNQGRKGLKHGPKEDRIRTEDILVGKHPDYQTYKLKKRLIQEGYFEDKCQRCGWSEKPEGAEFSPCELHHKDGDSHNHLLENLTLICPNCHSLTANYRAKNKK